MPLPPATKRCSTPCTEDVANPPSCTLVAAVLEGGVVHFCGIGDSRVYLLPDAGSGQILTVDDSMAQVMIAGGTPRAEAEASKQAHSITKWLGRDSPDVKPRVGRVEVDGPGWLLACSDGLWNYASEPDALRAQLDAAGSTDPHADRHGTWWPSRTPPVGWTTSPSRWRGSAPSLVEPAEPLARGRVETPGRGLDKRDRRQ